MTPLWSCEIIYTPPLSNLLVYYLLYESTSLRVSDKELRVLLLNQRGLYDLAMGRWSRYVHSPTHSSTHTPYHTPYHTHTLSNTRSNILYHTHTLSHTLSHTISHTIYHTLSHILSCIHSMHASSHNTLSHTLPHALSIHPLNTLSHTHSPHSITTINPPYLHSMVTVANWLSSRIVLQRSDIVVPTKPTGTPGSPLPHLPS